MEITFGGILMMFVISIALVFLVSAIVGLLFLAQYATRLVFQRQMFAPITYTVSATIWAAAVGIIVYVMYTGMQILSL